MITESSLQGKNIFLRNLRRSDVPIMVQWINNPEISRYLQVESPVTEEEESMWVENMRDGENDQVFAIIERATEEHVGNIGVHNISKTDKVATIGLFIGDISKQGKGYGKEAIELVTDFAFNELGLIRLQAPIFSFNKRSMAIFEKVGFKQDNSRSDHFWKNGENKEVLFFTRFKPTIEAK